MSSLDVLELEENLQKNEKNLEYLEEIITHLLERKKDREKMSEQLCNIVKLKEKIKAGLDNLVNDVSKLIVSEEGAILKFPVFKGKNCSSGKRNTPDDAAVLSTSKSGGLLNKGDRKSVQPSSKENDDNDDHDAHRTVKTTRISQSEHNLPQPESNKRKEPMVSGDIIEILDSDDEANPDGEVDTSNVCKNQTNFVRSPTCCQRRKQNRTDCVDDLFAKFTTKRKKVLKSSHDRNEDEAKCDSKTHLEKFNGSDNEITRNAGCRLGHGQSSFTGRTALDPATPYNVSMSGGAPDMPLGLQRYEVHVVAGKLHCASTKLSTIYRMIIEKELDAAGWTFKAVPDHIRDSWWTMFLNCCCWDVDRYKEVDMKMIFFKEMKDKYSKRLNDYKRIHVRTGKRPTFIDENVWRAWETEWHKPENKAKSNQCSANRLSEPAGPGTGISKHIGGSKSAIDHSLDIEREKGRPATAYEIFIRMHRKPDGTFVDHKSISIADEFQKRLDEARALLQDPDDNEVDENQIYLDVVGSKSGKFYGTGCFGKFVASTKGFNNASSQRDRTQGTEQ
ncbi:hypothetical protein CASFOL_036775 [Castilleja foliolosa]|uniref:Uncharacterized protein n=1 Tax=Castilleja foliolosa TaxID=1961234 RepID=A0ABD3BP44_9LAMI